MSEDRWMEREAIPHVPWVGPHVLRVRMFPRVDRRIPRGVGGLEETVLRCCAGGTDR